MLSIKNTVEETLLSIENIYKNNKNCKKRRIDKIRIKILDKQCTCNNFNFYRNAQ